VPERALKAGPRRVGGYELVRVIGRGGMATVYLARQVDLDRDVALKELAVFDAPDPQLARRFLGEARLAGSLSHPNIVTVHDYFEQDGTPYIAMEYLARGSLRPYVGRVSLSQIGGVLHGVLGGLAHAEEHGVVHRDIKPENIMVTSQGSVKIADFGIAKATSTATLGANLTTTGTTLGTPRYMAPERAMGEPIGPWSDLYSVGVMVFELLVGRTPFHETVAPVAILMRQINDPIPPVRSLVPDVDPALSDWVGRLLVKDPDERTRSASTAWRELDEILLDRLGARWPRDAALAAATGAAQPSGVRTSTTASPGSSTPTTAPMVGESALAATIAPATRRRGRVPDATPRRRGRRRRGLAALVVLGGAVMTAVAAAGTLGGREDRATGGAVSVSSAAGQVRLTAPLGWRQVAPRSSVPLPLADAVTVAGAAGGEVTAGVMTDQTAANVSLLPAPFLQSLGLRSGEMPPRARVVLSTAGLAAWRYRHLRPSGSDRPLTVYTVPTTAGVVTVVCVPPSAGDGAFSRACASIAGTLRIRGARAYALGPSAESAADADAGRTVPQPAESGVGDSRSDDPSDDEPDEEGD
jgi:hypothetical protein